MEKNNTDTLQIYRYLKKSKFFRNLDKNSLWPISDISEIRYYQPNELLIEQNTPPSGVFLIKEGKVAVFTEEEGGQENLISQLGSGEIIGEISVIDNLPTTASAKAIEPTECIFFSCWDFNTQMQSYPRIAIQLLPVLAKRIRKLMEQNK